MSHSERLVLWHRWLPPRRDEPGAHAALAKWRRAVEGRLQVSGGTVLGTLGASVAAAFDPADAQDVADMTLELLDEADEASIEVAFGLAVGPLEPIDGAAIGAPIERAQLLANRARAGEVVLDPAARDRVAEAMLFGRQVAAGAGAPRGTTLDRAHPRRLDCADAIRNLGTTTLPPVIASLARRIEEELEGDACRTFVLRGPVGAGTTELVGDLERRVRPARVWRIGAAPGGVVPLASMRLALARRYGTPDEVRDAFSHDGATPDAADVLSRVAAGELVPCDVLADALAALLVLETDEGARPWVVLSPLGLVDGATLAALLAARERADFVLFGRLPVETALPRPLAELDEAVREMTLPPLKMADARVVAEAVLGADTADDVARRVAVLGGDTVLGVVEAARTLIATGDLVHDGDGFVWRAGPRSGAHAIGTDELLSERLDLLDGHARRVLEALCVVPDGSPRALLADVVTHDGVPADRIDASLDLLAREALARGRERPRPASSLLRWRVMSLVPGGRAMELHRFVGEALRRELDRDGAATLPRRVELGFFMVEGGVEGEGRAFVTEALEPLVGLGYERAARQLSGWLAAGREAAAAAAGTGRNTPAPPPPGAHEEPPPSSELALDELLEEMAEEVAVAPAPPPPPPPAKPPPPPKPSRRLDAARPPAVAAADAALDAEVDALLTGEARFEDTTKPATRVAPDDAGPSAHDVPTIERSVPEESTEAVAPEGLDDEVDALIDAPWPTDDEVADDDEGFAVERTSVAPAPMRPFVEEVLRALRERDFEGLERAIQRAIADGGDLGAVARVRALGELARGDVPAARRSLAGARDRGRDDPATVARYLLAEALLDLRAGEPLAGVRAGLAALAASRRLTDARGEAAALRALAACYRALGRPEDATRLERAR